MKKLPLLLLSTLIAGSFSSAAMAEKKMLLKMPIYYNSVLPSLGSTAKYVADNMRTLSGNSLRVKLYEPNKLVHPKEILDAVSTGKVQAGYATAGNWGGKIPAARLFSSGPFGREAAE